MLKKNTPPIHVLIPSYNCAQYIEDCLESVAQQSLAPAQVLVIDDASTQEGYAMQVADICQMFGFQFLRNDTNRKCPYNIWKGVQVLDPGEHDVIFILDGDDKLPAHALARIAEAYADPAIWLTYGNYEPFPKNTGQHPAKAYPQAILDSNNFRKSPEVGNCFNHPLTFRRWLFDRIRVEDFKNSKGQWFRAGYDIEIMIPMLEMAGKDHFRFIDEVLYFYNATNPDSDSTRHKQELRESWQIYDRKPYPLLEMTITITADPSPVGQEMGAVLVQKAKHVLDNMKERVGNIERQARRELKLKSKTRPVAAAPIADDAVHDSLYNNIHKALTRCRTKSDVIRALYAVNGVLKKGVHELAFTEHGRSGQNQRMRLEVTGDGTTITYPLNDYILLMR